MAEVCLAERRKKQKWSSDPRGNSWSKDKNKFGYRMLEKMGWSDGSGLGAEEDGRTTHVKISYKNNTNGLGTTVQHSDDWIEHQTGFDGLLASLQQQQQQGGSSSEPGSASQSGRSSPSAGLRAKALKSRARINYNKFLRGKDISGYSNTDMSCILGVRSTASEGASSFDLATTDQQRESNDDSPDSGSNSDSSSESSSGTSKAKPHSTADSTTGLYTTVSGQSVQDYFAAKMAKLRRGPPPEADDRNNDVVQSPVAVKRKRKSSQEEDDDSDDENDSNEVPQPKKKKKKKSEKEKSKSKKSKSKPDVVEEREDRQSSDEEMKKPEKEKSKSKKSKSRPEVIEQQEDQQSSDEEIVKKKKKKKSKKANSQ